MSLFPVVLWCGVVAVPPVVPGPADVPDEVEVAPPPRLAGPRVSVVAIKGGYQIALNRPTAELFGDALDRADEKELAATLRKMAKDRKADDPDDATAAKLELAAFVVSSQVPGFRKALHDNMGPGGVVITMTGLQGPPVKFKKPRPRLEKALQAFRRAEELMPADARDAVEALRAVATTTPLFWKVEPRP